MVKDAVSLEGWRLPCAAGAWGAWLLQGFSGPQGPAAGAGAAPLGVLLPGGA